MSENLHLIAIICFIIGGLSALIMVIDLLAGHRQQMWIRDGDQSPDRGPADRCNQQTVQEIVAAKRA